IIDIGLRLDDVERFDLESEPVSPRDFDSRRQTLRKHGATIYEIDYLRNRRVELNALTSRQFIDLIEEKFEEHGVQKVVPDDRTRAAHYRQVVEHRLVAEALSDIRAVITAQVAAEPVPDDLVASIRELFRDDPSIAWDEAVARIARG